MIPRRALLLLVALAAVTGSLVIAQHSATAGTNAIPGVRPVRAVVGLVRGLVARNRVYGDVNEYRLEANALHDAYVNTAREQLAKGTAGGLRPGQLAQYRRTIALLEAEKAGRETYLDEQAIAAKKMFSGRVKEVVKAAISATPLGQRTIGLLADGFDAGKRGIDDALASLTTGNVGRVLSKLEKVRRLGEVGSAIGGQGVRNTFSKLDRVLGAPQDQLDRLRTQLEDLSGSLDATSADLRTYATESRAPRGSDLTKLVALSALGLDGERPGAEAAAGALTRSRPSIRAEARARILAGAQARCTAKAIGFRQLLTDLERSLGDDAAPAALGAVCQAIDLDALTPSGTDSTDVPDSGSVDSTVGGPTTTSASVPGGETVTAEGTLQLPAYLSTEFVTDIAAQQVELTFDPEGGPVTGSMDMVVEGVGDVAGACPFTLTWTGPITGSLDATTMTGSAATTLTIEIHGPADECIEGTSPLTGTLDATWNAAAQLVQGSLSFSDPEDPSDVTTLTFEAAVAA